MFEIDNENYIFIKSSKSITFIKDNNKYNMKLCIGENTTCKLYLKDYSGYLNINIVKSSYEEINKKHIINYLLESDEEETRIEIEEE